MQILSPTFRRLLAAATLAVASAVPALAHAEQEFPGALTEAADMECVPTCLMCHTVNPGTAGTWTQKPIGIAVGTIAVKGEGDVDAFNVAWNAYVARAATEPAVAANIALVKKGIEPSAMQDVCGPKYGCGASFARTPSKGSLSTELAAACFALVASLWVVRRRLRSDS